MTSTRSRLRTTPTWSSPTPAAAPSCRGEETIRDEYGALFEASPDLRAEILGRVSGGAWTVDHERVERDGDTRELLVAYQVADGLITRVLLLG